MPPRQPPAALLIRNARQRVHGTHTINLPIDKHPVMSTIPTLARRFADLAEVHERQDQPDGVIQAWCAWKDATKFGQ